MKATTAAEVMTRGVLTVDADWSVSELATFLDTHAISGAPVVDAEGALLGVVSVTDIARRGAAAESSVTETHAFFEKYGPKTIILARFVPVVRTFTPVLAGVSQMTYKKFICFNVIGGAAWVASLVYAGYLFGNIPWVKENIAWIVVGIVIVSLVPIAVQFVKEHHRHS